MTVTINEKIQSDSVRSVEDEVIFDPLDDRLLVPSINKVHISDIDIDEVLLDENSDNPDNSSVTLLDNSQTLLDDIVTYYVLRLCTATVLA